MSFPPFPTRLSFDDLQQAGVVFGNGPFPANVLDTHYYVPCQQCALSDGPQQSVPSWMWANVLWERPNLQCHRCAHPFMLSLQAHGIVLWTAGNELDRRIADLVRIRARMQEELMEIQLRFIAVRNLLSNIDEVVEALQTLRETRALRWKGCSWLALRHCLQMCLCDVLCCHIFEMLDAVHCIVLSEREADPARKKKQSIQFCPCWQSEQLRSCYWIKSPRDRLSFVTYARHGILCFFLLDSGDAFFQRSVKTTRLLTSVQMYLANTWACRQLWSQWHSNDRFTWHAC